MIRHLAPILILTSLLNCSAYAAGKITTDPNLSPKSAIGVSDERLNKKITYDSGYNRLWRIADDLKASSGVQISSGANKADWLVRDLPLVVCANNVQLGSLLRSIADTAHLSLTSEKIGVDDKDLLCYRILNSGSQQREWDNYVKEKRKAEEAYANWAWDALLAFGNIANSDFKYPLNKYQGPRVDLLRTLSGVISSLGPDAKESVIYGDQRIDLSAANCAGFAQLYKQAKQVELLPRNTVIEDPDDDELSDAKLSIFCDGQDPGEQFRVNYAICPIIIEKSKNSYSMTSWSSELSELDDLWNQVKNRTVPPRPDTLSFKEPPDHIPSSFSHLVADPNNLSLNSPNEWPSEALQEKVHIELPTDRDLTYAETLSAVSKASGWTIIAENYLDHRLIRTKSRILGSSGGHICPLKSTKLDASMGDILCKLAYLEGWPPYINWYINDKEKIAIGRSNSWIRDHKNLIPESLLADLGNKANSTGIELDDLVRLTNYTTGPQCEWIQDSKDLYYLYVIASGITAQDAFWHFYNRLPAQDKALAKSDEGLPLMKYDIRWISSFMKAVRKENDRGLRYTSYSDQEAKRKDEEQEENNWAMLSNLKVVQSLVLHIKRIDISYAFVDYWLDSHYKTNEEDIKSISYRVFDRHTYIAQLDGQCQGEPVTMKFSAPYKSFPIYSPDREIEIHKKAEEKTK